MNQTTYSLLLSLFFVCTNFSGLMTADLRQNHVTPLCKWNASILQDCVESAPSKFREAFTPPFDRCYATDVLHNLQWTVDADQSMSHI